MAKTALRSTCAQGNVVQFPGRFNPPPSPKQQFLRACMEAEAAKAYYDWTFARCGLAQLDGDPAAIKAERAEHQRAFDQLLESVDRLADVPATCKPFLDRKRRVIGKMWLKAEGPWGDRLRQCVEADAARLG